MSNSNNVRLGPCRVFFGGVDLGLTQGGVEFEVKTETHAVNVDQFGKSIINEIIIGRTCMVKVPLAETTMDNLIRTMPGAYITQSGGTLATGTVTFTAASTAGDSVTINGITLTCAAVPANYTQFGIGASATAQAALFAAAVNAIDDIATLVTATSAIGVVTLTAENYDSAYFSSNTITLAKSGSANTVVSGATLTGGVVPTKEIASVPTSVGSSLLATAQPLILHPQANSDANTTEDVVIPLANTAGGMKFAYVIDKERVFDISFTGYPNAVTTLLYQIGR